MKLYEFLKVMEKSSFVIVSTQVCGIQFEARHSVEYFTDNGEGLNDKNISMAYMADGELHIKLED